MRRILLGATGGALLAFGSAQAADLGTGVKDLASAAHCRFITDATVLVSVPDLPGLKVEVWRRYEHAVHVANDSATIYSSSPRFVWAHEAKAACAKAYGYLRGHWWGPERNIEMLQKCECFHDRMLQYLASR